MKLEETLKELEETANKLDSKELSLDEAIALFESGVKLIKSWMGMRNESKGKIDGIISDLDNLLKNGEGE